jgi:hypothetical protein
MSTTLQVEDGTVDHDLVAELYEARVRGARERFAHSDVVQKLTSSETSPATLDRFLIHFCAQGVHMTEPVEAWIKRAGERCIEIGFADLGSSLVRHAAHEAGHHEMMIADTISLVGRWNATQDTELSAREILDRKPSPGVDAYRALHESTIASAAPFGQLGIEYEIERLSVTVGPVLLGNIAAICGPGRIELLSFLTEHVEVDAGHTVLNRRLLNDFLDQKPDAAEQLGEAGCAALDSYAQFLSDCLDRSVE